MSRLTIYISNTLRLSKGAKDVKCIGQHSGEQHKNKIKNKKKHQSLKNV